MEENKITVFAALFGLTGEKATAENVTAKINELKAKADKSETIQKSLDDTQAKLKEVEAELTGAKTSVNNLTEDLNKTKAALKEYQDAEAKAKEEKVNTLIEQAIAECKINKEEKDAYIKMAQDNYDLAVNVLAKIPARDNLGNILAESNKNNAANGMETEEKKVLAKVNEIVGKDFQFRSLD